MVMHGMLILMICMIIIITNLYVRLYIEALDLISQIKYDIGFVLIEEQNIYTCFTNHENLVLPEWKHRQKQMISNYNRSVKSKEYHSNKNMKKNERKTIKKNTQITKNYKTQSPRNFRYK